MIYIDANMSFEEIIKYRLSSIDENIAMALLKKYEDRVQNLEDECNSQSAYIKELEAEIDELRATNEDIEADLNKAEKDLEELKAKERRQSKLDLGSGYAAAINSAISAPIIL